MGRRRPPAADDARVIENGDESRVKLIGWLRPIIGEGNLETEGDVRFTLLQRAKLGEKEVDDFIYELGSQQPLEGFANEIVDTAENDCEELRGKITYVVRAEGRVKGCTFWLKVPKLEFDEDDDEYLEEIPGARGLVHQGMRHTEVFAKEMLASARLDKSLLLGMIRDLREENAELKRHQFEQIKITEQLRSMQFARDLEIKKMEKSDERKEQAMKMAMKTLPLIAAKVMGGGSKMAADLGAPSPLDELLGTLITGLQQKPGKIEKLVEILDPVEQATFMEIYQYVMQKRQMAEEAAAKAAGGAAA